MDKSDSITNLAAALCKAQPQIKAAEMNAVNPFLKNKYADLGSVTDAIKPALAENGLSFVQLVGGAPGTIELETVLMHESGEWMSTLMLFDYGEEKGRSLAQSAGGIITYLRRYQLAALFGVYADEDSDGNGRQPHTQPQAQAQRQSSNGNQSERQQLDPEALADALARKAKSYAGREASKQQRGLLAGMLGQILLDDGSRHIVQEYLFGVTSLNDADDAVILAALDWMKPEKDSGGAYKPNPLAEKETHATHKFVLQMQGQQDMF